MEQAELRDAAADLVNRFMLPNPWDLGVFVRQIAAVRGRPIQLLPTKSAGGMCGLWVETDTADYIAYAEETTSPHQEWIILHEVGHIVYGHPSRPTGRVTTTQYNDWQEQQAETFACEVMSRAGQQRTSLRLFDTTELRIITALDPGAPVAGHSRPRSRVRRWLLHGLRPFTASR